jgi:hypothetical protein
MRARGLVVGVLGLTACRYQPSPVPLQATPPEIAALAGEWSGEYSGVQSGRTGGITLQIVAGRDTAFGDVTMISNTGHRLMPADAPRDHLAHARSADVLRVTFVRVAEGRVTGALEPYTAPDCRCVVSTTFSGTIQGDVVEGTFVTRSASGLEQNGRWRVTRRR